MSFDPGAVERVRAVLFPLAAFEGDDCEEKRMFGSLCFLIGGHISLCVTRDGLLVRVGRDAMDQALSLRHVTPMEMRGRPMSGFVRVAPGGFATEADLRMWAERGLVAAKAVGR